MNLAHGSRERGYAMAALLVAMAVMAIVLSAALPTWNQMIRRDKEEELVFRGMQYARAINFYQRKYANASPPSLDVLIEQRMLRKKYKDPMSPEKDGEFQLLYLSNVTQSGRLGGPNTGQSGQSPQTAGTGMVLGTTPTGGIMGVASKNKSESIRIYNGKTHYNEWQFTAMQQSLQGGAGGQNLPAGARGSMPTDGTFTGRDRGGNRMNMPPPSPFDSGARGRQGQGQNPPPPQSPGRGFNLPPR